MLNIHGDDHSELVFELVSYVGVPLLDRLVSNYNTLVKFIPCSLQTLTSLSTHSKVRTS